MKKDEFIDAGYLDNSTVYNVISVSFNQAEEEYNISYFKDYGHYPLSKTNNIKNCTFEEDVYILQMDAGITFENCIFKKKLIFFIKQNKNIQYTDTFNPDEEGGEPLKVIVDKDLSKEKIEFIGGKIETLEIKNSNFQSKFYINPQDEENSDILNIEELIIKDTEFNQNFKLHNCHIEKFTLVDTDFEKNADFFMSHVAKGTLKKDVEGKTKKNDIGFKSINFKGLALFGDTEFHKKLLFKYVTFEGFSHFRNAEFREGLDLDYSNIQQEMNFHGVTGLKDDIAKENTSQETYRIIKHNFEKIGNKIDANKYHALELEQKKNNLKNSVDEETIKDVKIKKWFEYLVFQIHGISSEHSTNWLLVLYWILMVGLFSSIMEKASFLISLIPISIIISLLISRFDYKLLFFLGVFSVSAFFADAISFNDFVKNISLINLSKLPSIKAVSPVVFFNKVLLGYLYYQFLMSIRKDTRK